MSLRRRTGKWPSMLPSGLMRSALVVCLLATVCAAQGAGDKAVARRPDMSGEWVLDKSRSDFGPFAESPVAQSDITLVVAQSEPEFKVTRRMSRQGREVVEQLVYYTDGRGETNQWTLGRVGVKSRTKWDGGKLVSESSVEHKGAAGATATLSSVERRQLSSDGKTLTQTNVIEGPQGRQSVKQVFRRAPRS